MNAPNTALLYPYSLQRVHSGIIIGLRSRVLRPGMPMEAARFEGDDDPHTHHFAMIHKEDAPPVGCVSFMQVNWGATPAWQLRGMAVEDEHRNRGVGSQLLAQSLAFIQEEVQYDHIHILWCNARISAVPFYERNKWFKASSEFDVPDVGPHIKMKRRLSSLIS